MLRIHPFNLVFVFFLRLNFSREGLPASCPRRKQASCPSRRDVNWQQLLKPPQSGLLLQPSGRLHQNGERNNARYLSQICPSCTLKKKIGRAVSRQWAAAQTSPKSSAAQTIGSSSPKFYTCDVETIQVFLYFCSFYFSKRDFRERCQLAAA